MRKVTMRLVGEDGNAWSILGRFQRAAKAAGWTREEIKAVMDDATSGDYDHLLAVMMEPRRGAGRPRHIVPGRLPARPPATQRPSRRIGSERCGQPRLFSSRGLRWSLILRSLRTLRFALSRSGRSASASL